MQDMVRTRVAPSPTGYPHLGLVYQAIFDYVLAHKYGGKFVLRIEDTDRTRFVEGAEDVIYNALRWVHLVPDEGPREKGDYGPYRQSERLEFYQKYANQLIGSGHAYRCFCTKERLEEMRKTQESRHASPMYDKTCRSLSLGDSEKKKQEGLAFTIRMKVPENKTIVVPDALVGEVSFDSNQIDDQVILKSDGFPTYHLAVVVDDYLMKITHVFRGTEWLPSLPKHVLLWEFLGWKENMPVFIHVPVLLNSQGGGKLSKRHAHTSVTYYQEEGFLPEAVVNYLANIVWNHPEGKEIFPIMDFSKALEIDPLHFDIKPNGVHFDLEKLLWMNGEYIRLMSNDELHKHLTQYYQSQKNEIMVNFLTKNEKAFINSVMELSKTRIKILKDFQDLVLPLDTPLSGAEKEVAKNLKEVFNSIETWNKETVLAGMREVLQKQKVKGSMLYKIFTGREHGLPLPEMLELFGKEKTLEKLA